MEIQTSPPAPDSAEISLFGPGIGECVVLHAGEGRWFVVDSCRDPVTKRPIALDYLEGLGVDATEAVKGIVITHWHKDHIDGAFELFKACEKAKLHISAALLEPEAQYLATLFKRDVFASTDKEIREFAQIVEHLYKTQDRQRIDTVSEKHVFFDWRADQHTRLVAMSPSSSAKLQAIANLKSISPQPGSRRLRNIVPQNPNQNAIALHFSFGNFAAVLGSDLEESGNPATGWSAIIRSGLQHSLSLAKASLFKVPHHGSETGHHDEVWDQLLEPLPTSLTTPFTRSRLPKESDISRISKRSAIFWVTRDAQAKGKEKRDRMVEREMKTIVKERQSINDRMGHLQVRIAGDGQFAIASNGQPVAYEN